MNSESPGSRRESRVQTWLSAIHDRDRRISVGVGNVAADGALKQLVELHGGSLTITSRMGFGTTVTVDLPFLQAAVTAAA